MNEKRKNIENLPIFKKGQEIMDVVDQIAKLIDDEDEHLSFIKGLLYADAAQLTVKIAGA